MAKRVGGSTYKKPYPCNISLKNHYINYRPNKLLCINESNKKETEPVIERVIQNRLCSDITQSGVEDNVITGNKLKQCYKKALDNNWWGQCPWSHNGRECLAGNLDDAGNERNILDLQDPMFTWHISGSINDEHPYCNSLNDNVVENGGKNAIERYNELCYLFGYNYIREIGSPIPLEDTGGRMRWPTESCRWDECRPQDSDDYEWPNWNDIECMKETIYTSGERAGDFDSIICQ